MSHEELIKIYSKIKNNGRDRRRGRRCFLSGHSESILKGSVQNMVEKSNEKVEN